MLFNCGSRSMRSLCMPLTCSLKCVCISKYYSLNPVHISISTVALQAHKYRFLRWFSILVLCSCKQIAHRACESLLFWLFPDGLLRYSFTSCSFRIILRSSHRINTYETVLCFPCFALSLALNLSLAVPSFTRLHTETNWSKDCQIQYEKNIMRFLCLFSVKFWPLTFSEMKFR